MIRKLTGLAVLLPFLISAATAAEIGGVRMPDTMKAGETSLRLNGGGVRSRMMIELYVGGLYVASKTDNDQRIVNADEPMAIRLQILSSMITSERMEESTREGFKNSMGGDTAPLQKQIDQFIGVFKEEIKVGDVYDLVYLPGKGVEVRKNGNLKSTTEGLAFKKALFGIWLGEKPAQKSLKAEMLGG